MAGVDAGEWSQIDKPGRAEATLARVARGREVYGSDFLLAYYGAERGGRSLEKPLGSVMTKDRHAIVRGDRMRMLTVDEYRRAMGFPEGYALPRTKRAAVHMLGNAVCPPVAAEVVREVARRI